MATLGRPTRFEAARRIFTRILVGVSGSNQALEAARQAALLQEAGGRLTLLAAWSIAPTIIGGTGTEIPYYYDEELQRRIAKNALAAARAETEPYAEATPLLVRGTPAAALLEEIERAGDTLVAVGGSKLGRLLGIVEGSIASTVVHRAPCSVLAARPHHDGFPRRIAVGVDGSPESGAAFDAAQYLADRFEARLEAIAAQGGKGIEPRLVEAITSGAHEESRLHPVEALTDASRRADLVVVGSRGLHGLRSLGSVSERVTHGAVCSTLVVRRSSEP